MRVLQNKKKEGTDLIIENLREGWSDAMIKRVFRYTSELLQPFPLSKERLKDEKSKKILDLKVIILENKM
ncbi:hypothetical protein LWM68_20160 [Niabella sp. W65]|nr:hypothetical protein [Niabella sp. W65]MCH7364871.1 hypothetical protein [Niabella sp. W65]